LKSTNNLQYGHLEKIHNLADLKLLNKTKASHMDIAKWGKSGPLQPQVSLFIIYLGISLSLQVNNEKIKNALVCLIAASDLLFVLVEQKPLKESVQLLNVDSIPLMNILSSSGLSMHTTWMFLQSQETIKIKDIAKQAKLSFTQDVWTAPNCVSFMAVMAHFIDEKCLMRDLTLEVPQLEGQYFFLFKQPLFSWSGCLF
ncbi:uncharacterized protein VP01_5890g2, partial [Puccinia sorghi]